MTITLRYDDREVVKVVQAGLAAVTNLAPAMADIEDELLALSDQAFLTNSDPSTGKRWPTLKKATIRSRARAGYSGSDILQRIGSLKASVQADSGDNYAAVGASIEYALVHFTGGGNNIPARPFVGAGPEDLNSFEDIIAEFINKKMD